MAGPPLVDGVVVVQDGKITAVGALGEVAIPDGFELLEAAVVTPGLVDAHSVVGLAGQYNQQRGDQDIASALRLAREFELRLVLDGAAEAYLMLEELRAAGVPVIVHPTMQRSVGETENLSFETAAKLVAAGIPVALQSGDESYVPKARVVIFEAAVAAAHGLGFEAALATISRDAAKVLGVDGRVGTLELAKGGDLALYDGDPFEYTTHCVGAVIDGRLVSRGERQ